MIDSRPLLQAAPNSSRLSDRDYARFSELLLESCGLRFSERRRTELEMGVRQAFAASTCASLDEYFDLVRSSHDGSVELDQLINAVTVSETHFFRDEAQFDALFNHVLPKIIERRRPMRTLRVWSAGCASGEEPYSIAMLLRQLLPDVDEWAITILGTDINTQSLARARRASYGEWAFREPRAKQWRQRHFTPQGNRYELVPEVRRMVTFGKLNLAEPCYPSYETNSTLMDLILCRNVTIYFSEDVITQVVDRFYDALVDGGWLVVGHCEPSLLTYRRFQARNFPDTILYQRTGQPTVLPSDWVCPPNRVPAISPPALTVVPPVVPVAPPPPALLIVDKVAQCEAPEPDDAPSELDPVDHARELLECGQTEKARDVLLKLAASRPRHASTCALLGQAYANLGSWEEAELWCRKAIGYDKLMLAAYYTLALVLQHQEKLEPAIAMMKKVVYIDRCYLLGHFGLADLYHTHGQLQQAKKSLDNAAKLLEIFVDDELIPGSGGVTAGRLRGALLHLQQEWSA